MLYNVTFIRNDDYEVEAETEDEAIDKAFEMFKLENQRSIANSHYDEVEVVEIEDDED